MSFSAFGTASLRHSERVYGLVNHRRHSWKSDPLLSEKSSTAGTVPRSRLYQASIYSKIACPSSSRLCQACWSRSSRHIVDQNDSMRPLSTLDATLPMDPSSPARRSR